MGRGWKFDSYLLELSILLSVCGIHNLKERRELRWGGVKKNNEADQGQACQASRKISGRLQKKRGCAASHRCLRFCYSGLRSVLVFRKQTWI